MQARSHKTQVIGNILGFRWCFVLKLIREIDENPVCLCSLCTEWIHPQAARMIQRVMRRWYARLQRTLRRRNVLRLMRWRDTKGIRFTTISDVLRKEAETVILTI